jgi:tetratricopeptide (TPR) repeat protein
MNGGAQRPKRKSPSAERTREELLRPCPYLGYDHDRIGVHCLAKEAFRVAELCFRRAIWLNPYEPRFVVHLAHALFRQKRYEEAMEALEGMDPKWADSENVRDLRKKILIFTTGSTKGDK